MTDDLTAQVRVNLSVWAERDFVRHYRGHDLRPAEEAVLAAQRASFTGRVLELGCGAGRLTGHLIAIGGSVHGIDLSPRMIEHCTRHYPAASFTVCDLRDLSRFAAPHCEPWDAVVAIDNVLDILDDRGRRDVLRQIRGILRPGGLLFMSAHNRAFLPRAATPTRVRARSAARVAGKLALMPWRMYNHARLRRHEHAEPRYAVINDDAHHFRLLHYYITRASQEEQFGEEGLELVECRDGAGDAVLAPDDAAEHSELHYVARRPPLFAGQGDRRDAGSPRSAEPQPAG